MKNIDIKSLIIGTLLTSTIFLGVAATSKDDKGKWDDKQVWSVTTADQASVRLAKSGNALFKGEPGSGGWEPIGVQGANIIFRKRLK